MLNIPAQDERAVAVMTAIHHGDVDGLRRQLADMPELSHARIEDDRGIGRTLLHVVADWPGHFENGPLAVAALVEAGADLNACIQPGAERPSETPLHWAASSGDVGVVDALLDGGADIEAPGAVFTGGTPMSDAVVFAQWRVARRLLDRGARTTVWQAAALGLLDSVRDLCTSDPRPTPDQITNAFWHACRGGQRDVAAYLLDRGADENWVGYERRTPLDVAEESENESLIQWLRGLGAKNSLRHR